MKKSVLLASAAIMMCYFTSCSGGKKTEEAAAPAEEAKTEAAVPEYKLMNDLPTVDLSTFPKDADGKVTLFDGNRLPTSSHPRAPPVWILLRLRRCLLWN